VQIGDLGLSQMMPSTHISGTQSLTSPRWMAPEVLRGSAYNTASDVFSFGVILWELTTLQVTSSSHPSPYIRVILSQAML
jgi:serine/threonine protein kinase